MTKPHSGIIHTVNLNQNQDQPSQYIFIMKKRAIFLCMLSLSLFGYGQSKISLETLISKIKENKSNFNAAYRIPLLIDKDHFNQTISDYDVYIVDENNFRIKSKNTEGIIFQFVYAKGKSSGIAVEIEKEYGYRFSNSTTNGRLIFNETAKEDLIFTCGGSHHHSKTIQSKQENTKEGSSTSRNIGNSGTVTDPLLLESRPGATHLIYLDYDGENTLPGWEAYNYSTTVVNVPDHLKREFWEEVAEDFLPFDVNVTNNRELYDNHVDELTKGWVVIADYGNQVWAGVAQLDSYGTGTPVLVDLPNVFNESDPFLYLAVSHELGHALSLNHDGSPSSGYYAGHGEYSPIMGNGSFTVSHWSKGEYAGATNTEDDIMIIGSWLGNVPDDYTSPQTLVIDGTVVLGEQNSGVIENEDDTDTFEINLTTDGEIILTISSPIDWRTNLDVVATLKNDNGDVIETSAPIGDRSAYIDKPLAAGTYYLTIDGGGELGSNEGFTDYSSYGYYELSGRVGYLAPESMFSFVGGNICSGDAISFTNQSVGTNLSYEWTFEGADMAFSTEENPTITYSNPGIFNVFLKTTNLLGENTTERQIHVGSAGYRIELATEKLNPELKGIITLTNEVITFTYDDLSNLDQDVAYYEMCLLSECYTIQLDKVYVEETCGYELWQSDGAYWGGDQVFYQGGIYKAKWWTDDLPTNTAAWDFVTVCEITDLGNPIRVFNNEDAVVFETNPVNVGHDLFLEDEFCGNTLSVSEFVIADEGNFDVFPNPTSGILNIKGERMNQITVYNILGSRMKTYEVNGNEFELDVSNYGNGVYFIAIVSNNKQVVKKIYKE